MKLICLVLAAAAGFAQTTRYPGALDSDSSLFVVSDNVQTTLNAAMGTGDTAAVVASATGFVPNMIATICDTTTNTGKCTAWEHMFVTAVSGNILTVTRAFAGTTARTHSSGRLVSVLIDSAHQKVLKDSVVAIETALGPNLSNIAASGPLVPAGSYNFSAYSCNSSSVCVPAGVSGMSLIAGNNSLTMTPVPNGVNGTDTGHSLYISGGIGTAEACAITGGSGSSGQASGQIIINCAGAHSGAWTITSASGGLQEAICALPPAGGQVVVQTGITLRANVSVCGKTSVTVQRFSGATISGAFTVLGSTSNGSNPEFYSGINWPSLTNERDMIRVQTGNFPISQQFAGGTLPSIGGIIGATAIDSTAAANTGANGLGGYARSDSPTGSAVGIYGEGVAGVNGSQAWGGNVLVTNCVIVSGSACPANSGTTNINLYSIEADTNVIPLAGGAAPSGNVNGIWVAGGSLIQPTGTAIGVHIGQMGAFNNISWKEAIRIDDGAASLNGIYIGSLTSGNNTGSMDIVLNARDSAGANHQAVIATTTVADLLLRGGNFNTGVNGGVWLQDAAGNNGARLMPNGSTPYFQVNNQLALPVIGFTSLPTAVATGAMVFCNTCTTAATCAGGGSGHVAVWSGSAWMCN